MIDCTFEKSNSSDTSGFCLEDVWTIRSLVMQEESHAYFRNPSHLINSLDARKYDRVGTKSHVLESGSTMGKKLQKKCKKRETCWV